MRTLASEASRQLSGLLGVAIVAIALAGARDAAAQTCHVEQATMRDGVKLATEVYLPDGKTGPFPVILQRSPYNRFPPGPGGNCSDPQMRTFAAAGYAALNQDTRGRYRSEGTMDAMQQEAEDGYDAIEWAGTQSWSTGKVGTVGGSYVGLTQWQPAIHDPPHLAAMAPLITASDYHDHWTYVNGVFDLWFAQSWMLLTFAGEQLMRNLEAAGMSAAEVQAATTEWIAQGRADILEDWVWRLPLTSFDEYNRSDAPYDDLAPYYQDWLDHPYYDEFWQRMDVEPRYDQVKVPVLNIGWWYDIFQVGTVRNFQGMREHGGSEAAREGSMLVMWSQCHACPPGTKAGEIDFGPDNQRDLNALYIRFFDRWLKGIPNGIDREPAVQLFVMEPPDSGTEGGGYWAYSETFPMKVTRTETLHLRSGGHANTAAGDGVLARGVGSGEASDAFVYDPANPVPTKGGNMCCINDLLPSGAFDQRDIENRDDVLVYTGEALAKDMTVVGTVKVRLFAATDAVDTDFTAKLVDVHPDGYAQNLLDRIVRAELRVSSKGSRAPIVPGQVYEYEIDLGHTATVFKKGHRVRLEVSSSNFPHYARNLNTGESTTGETIVVANQTIFHDARHQSVLELPVVPYTLAPVDEARQRAEEDAERRAEDEQRAREREAGIVDPEAQAARREAQALRREQQQQRRWRQLFRRGGWGADPDADRRDEDRARRDEDRDRRAEEAHARHACSRLEKLTFEGNTSVSDATLVTSGTLVTPNDLTLTDLPSFCRVQGVSRPTSESSIYFEVWLPTETWNGKFLSSGEGGYAGQLNYTRRGLDGGLDEIIRRGYATASTDTGHSAADTFWAVGHPERAADYLYRAKHLVTVAAKGLIAAHYGRPPTRSYFNSCSNGGRQALIEAQRYPDDYDGYVVGAPWNFQSHSNAGFVWNAQALSAPGAAIPPAKLPAINAAVLAACDADDGLADGVIADPPSCDFDPQTLLCSSGDAETCLTAPQLAALRAIYQGPKNPQTGEAIFPGFALGSELAWTSVVTNLTAAGLGNGYFANLVYEDPAWDYRTFDFNEDMAFADMKVGVLGNAISPDLGAAKERGVKIIQYHGWNEQVLQPAYSPEYYETVIDAMGGLEETQEFYRLFMVPGMTHCYFGPGAASFGGVGQQLPPARDPLHDIQSALENWVENGIAPETIVATKYVDDMATTREVLLQRPLCPYPAVPQYDEGDPNAASSFECVGADE